MKLFTPLMSYKKILLTLIIIFSQLSCYLYAQNSAKQFTYKGIQYEIDSVHTELVTLKKVQKSPKDILVIPHLVYNRGRSYVVDSIDSYAFCPLEVTTLRIDSVRSIGTYALDAGAKIDSLYLGTGVEFFNDQWGRYNCVAPRYINFANPNIQTNCREIWPEWYSVVWKGEVISWKDFCYETNAELRQWYHNEKVTKIKDITGWIVSPILFVLLIILFGKPNWLGGIFCPSRFFAKDETVKKGLILVAVNVLVGCILLIPVAAISPLLQNCTCVILLPVFPMLFVLNGLRNLRFYTRSFDKSLPVDTTLHISSSIPCAIPMHGGKKATTGLTICNYIGETVSVVIMLGYALLVYMLGDDMDLGHLLVAPYDWLNGKWFADSTDQYSVLFLLFYTWVTTGLLSLALRMLCTIPRLRVVGNFATEMFVTILLFFYIRTCWMEIVPDFASFKGILTCILYLCFVGAWFLLSPIGSLVSESCPRCWGILSTDEEKGLHCANCGCAPERSKRSVFGSELRKLGMKLPFVMGKGMAKGLFETPPESKQEKQPVPQNEEDGEEEMVDQDGNKISGTFNWSKTEFTTDDGVEYERDTFGKGFHLK